MSGRTDSIDREQGQITARDIELELEISRRELTGYCHRTLGSAFPPSSAGRSFSTSSC
ncbi:MAG: hypothetical protein F2754_03425 [Actinobacteria bacterium]|uniref:Unannotated protein n=1 Tax=freshwater metagenome TaxID=449393 RepID=A0A6J6ZGH2_9ZZZZ|nr:hypothetical protein [Actinomycetota bacterium]